MPEEEKIQAEKTVLVKGTVGFAPSSPTPSWALWMFRTEFIFNKALTYYITGTDKHFDTKEILLIAATIDLITWLFAHSMGVKKKDVGLPGED